MLPVAGGTPRATGRRGRGDQPVACRLGHGGGSRGRRPGGHHPRRRRRRGRRGGRRDAARCRADRPRARPGAGRPELHGRHRPDLEQRHLHRRRLAVPATRRRRRDRAVGLGHRRVRPLGEPGRFLADHQLRLGGRARPVRLPGLLPRRPGDELGHPVRRGVQAARAVPRARGPGARAGQADHGGQGRTERPGTGRGGRPFRVAGRRDARHRRRARCRRGHPLPRSRRAARDRRAGRGRPADRPADRPRTDGRGDGLDRRGVAHRRPGAADRRRPAADPAVRAGSHPRGAADDGLHRQPARSVGRRRPGDGVRRGVRGDGGHRRLRRPGPRPRLPVPLASVRGRDRQRGHPGAARRDRRSDPGSCRSTCR